MQKAESWILSNGENLRPCIPQGGDEKYLLNISTQLSMLYGEQF